VLVSGWRAAAAARWRGVLEVLQARGNLKVRVLGLADVAVLAAHLVREHHRPRLLRRPPAPERQRRQLGCRSVHIGRRRGRGAGGRRRRRRCGRSGSRRGAGSVCKRRRRLRDDRLDGVLGRAVEYHVVVGREQDRGCLPVPVLGRGRRPDGRRWWLGKPWSRHAPRGPHAAGVSAAGGRVHNTQRHTYVVDERVAERIVQVLAQGAEDVHRGRCLRLDVHRTRGGRVGCHLCRKAAAGTAGGRVLECGGARRRGVVKVWRCSGQSASARLPAPPSSYPTPSASTPRRRLASPAARGRASPGRDRSPTTS